MNYHDIKKDDMLNGEGLRVILFVSGCTHACPGCHNKETWDTNSGILFDEKAKKEIHTELEKNHVDGLTLSGGDPLHSDNIDDLFDLISGIKIKFPKKTIWLYTGFTWENCFPKVVTDDFNLERIKRQELIKLCDVMVDGQYIETLSDKKYPYAGSTNQRMINIKEYLTKSRKEGECI